MTLLLALIVQVSFAQQKTVTGTVSDEAGVPLLGVTIVVKGTTSGTSTDFDGNYSIQTQEGATLQFTYIGYQQQEKLVGASNVVNVTLSEDTEALDEVVVTAFGRTMTRNESTSSVVTVGSEEISKSPFVDVQQSLQGKVSGMTVTTSSGVPGSASTVRIRGRNSLNASNNPLYVVDGVPIVAGNIGGSSNATSMDIFALIGNANIESVSVLKDAAAVAPYGADGANGVILVTTKSGKRGEAKYTLNTSTGVVNNAVRGVRAMTADQREEAIALSIGSVLGVGYEEAYDYAYDGDFGKIKTWDEAGRHETNWADAVRNKNALMQNYDFSVTQGNETSNFAASLSYNNTEATVIGSDFERISGSLRYNTQLNDKLNLELSAIASNADQNAALENGAYFSNPNLSKYFLSPFINPYNSDGSYNLDDFGSMTSLHNVLFTANDNIRNNNVTRAIQNTTLSYDILDNLTFRSVMGLDYNIAYWKSYDSPLHGDGIDENGRTTEASTRRFNYTTQNSLDYVFNLGENHHFRTTALVEYQKQKTSSLSGYGENFPNEFLNNISAASANYDASSSFSDAANIRYVGLVNYALKGKYLADLSYSYQGTSKFSDKYDSFYAAGLGWNIHREDFLKDSESINELRLKAGYGITGNAGIGRNQYQALMGFSNYANNPAAIITGYGTEASWEKSKRMDLSLDFGLFANRLSGSVGVFSNETTDMLLNAPIPVSATFLDGGSASILKNLGNMTNKGVELEVFGVLIDNPDFRWTMGGNYTSLRNKVTYMPDGLEIIGTQSVVAGHSAYEWFMEEWAGVDPDNGDPLWYVDRTVDDQTTNVYADAEKNYQGSNFMPKYSGSISTRFDIHNFFVEGSLNFAGGNKVYEDWASYTQSTTSNIAIYNSSQQAYYGAWREPGDIATHPRFDYNTPIVGAATSTSTRFLHKGDYLRLRDVAVGYTFKHETLNNTGLDGLTITLRGTNLLTWVKDDNMKWDPEISGGFTNLTTPPVKSVVLNVNLNF